MRRFFGTAKPKEPAPSLGDMTQRVDARVGYLDSKIKGLDVELLDCKQKLARMPANSPAKNAIRQRAARALRQKKMYEQQRDQLMQQSFNMEQAKFMTEAVQDTAATVAAMKETKAVLQNTMKGLPIDGVYDLLDDMEDLYDITNEVQEVMSRSYGTPEVDDAELDAELSALTEELMETDEADAMYLASAAMPAAPVSALPAVPAGPTRTQAGPQATKLAMDEDWLQH